jgi:hypothetical protein
MRTASIVAGLALAVSACGSGGGQATGNVTSVRLANPQSEQLKGMSDLYRNLGLRRAIMDSSQRCKRSEGGAYQQDYKNMAMWTTHCVDTGDWAIFISPGGEVQVRPCADLASLGLPTCKRAPAGPAKAAEKAKAKGSVPAASKSAG